MRALILGAGGQVGRALIAVAPAGATAIAAARADCDVGDERALEQAIAAARPDLVFNAAAFTNVDGAESEPDEAHRLNAVAPGTIAALARAHGARTVHLSTDFLFGGTGSTPWRPDDATAPGSVYARTKLEGEQRVAAADPAALIVRTAWVYAAGGRNFVATMLRLMGERDSISVVDDQLGTPTWARSLAGALWALAGAGAGGIHHFTDAGTASWYDFAVAVAEEGSAAGLLSRPARVVPIRTVDYPTPAARPPYSVLDKSATWALLGGPAPHWRVNLRAALKDWSGHG